MGCLNPNVERPSGVSNYVRNILPELTKIGLDAQLIGVGPEAGSSLPYDFVSLWPHNGLTSYGFLIRLFAATPRLELSNDSVINVHRPDDMIPFLLANRANPKVITLHGTHFKNVYLKKGRVVGKVYDFLEKLSITKTNQLISVSQEAKVVFSRRYPEKEERIHFIPPGVDTNAFKQMDQMESRRSLGLNEDDFIVLYVGRLEREKKLDLLLKAFRDLKRQRPSAKLLIAGEGGDRRRLENLVSSFNLRDVSMLGFVERLGLPLLMNSSDVFCLLSTHEGFPSVVLEALACGLPVVSTRVGDVPKVVIEGLTGSILDSSEPQEIANKIAEIGSLKNAMTHACIRTASDYSWCKVAESTAKVYAKALSEIS